jgi:hypothetical protein
VHVLVVVLVCCRSSLVEILRPFPPPQRCFAFRAVTPCHVAKTELFALCRFRRLLHSALSWTAGGSINGRPAQPIGHLHSTSERVVQLELSAAAAPSYTFHSSQAHGTQGAGVAATFIITRAPVRLAHHQLFSRPRLADARWRDMGSERKAERRTCKLGPTASAP